MKRGVLRYFAKFTGKDLCQGEGQTHESDEATQKKK